MLCAFKTLVFSGKCSKQELILNNKHMPITKETLKYTLNSWNLRDNKREKWNVVYLKTKTMARGNKKQNVN